MTNTIPNVPRQLLERAWRALANSATGREIGAYLDADPCAPECAETCARASMCSTCSALLSAPSPAGVDGLEVMSNWVLFDAEADKPYIKKMLPEGFLAFFDCEEDARRAKANNPGTDYKRIDRVKAEDAQAIIDGLRGENERIRLNIAEYNEAISCYQSERDQQARRIGELEGLLRKWRRIFDRGPGSGQLGVLRGQTDAALSAGKDSD